MIIAKNLVVLGTQWGDEGKGSIVDYLADDHDIVARFQGGNNAGHTTVVDGEEYKSQLLPSGAVAGKKIVCGNGMVINPKVILREIEGMRNRGIEITPDNLSISDNAAVIMPYHIEMDIAKEKAKGKKSEIGTTKRGIGPAYEDEASREGIRMGMLLDSHIFEHKLNENMELYKNVIERVYGQEFPLDYEEVLAEYKGYAEKLRPFIQDTFTELQEDMERGKKILFESAQGTFLDKDHGTYPYVTSSNPISGGVSIGAGVGPKDIDGIIGIVKAYTTRVGRGPFPTELGDDQDSRFLKENIRDIEKYSFEDIMSLLQSDNPYEIGLGLRLLNSEYGTVTERPRRTGNLDGVMLKKSRRLNSLTSLAITRLDGLGGMKELKIGKSYIMGGKETQNFPSTIEKLALCEPVYEYFDGFEYLKPDEWMRLGGYKNFPKEARLYTEAIQDIVDAPVGIISVGPGREHKIPL